MWLWQWLWLWLWPKLAAAAQIRPLAWELPYAASVALKRPKKKKNWKIVNEFTSKIGIDTF